MCRYEEDYEWYVESENPRVSDKDEKCEDCGRVIPAGERHTLFTAMENEDARYDSPYVCAAQQPTPGQKYIDPTRPWIRLGDDSLIFDTFDALGFVVEETCEYDLNPPDPTYHISCNHCRAADIWLQEVCSQSTVLVAVMDLAEHWNEYSPEQLGPDFGTLYKLSTQQWRSKLTGELLPVPVIERLAKDAAAHALVSGITD